MKLHLKLSSVGTIDGQPFKVEAFEYAHASRSLELRVGIPLDPDNADVSRVREYSVKLGAEQLANGAWPEPHLYLSQQSGEHIDERVWTILQGAYYQVLVRLERYYQVLAARAGSTRARSAGAGLPSLRDVAASVRRGAGR